MTRIALVVLDTLRKDAFDQHFSWLPGRRFERAWSTAKWTMPAHASLFTGTYASEAGANANSEGLDCPEPVLAELLSDAEYTPRAFSANLMVSPIFGFDRGFDSFEGTWRININSKGITGWRELFRNSHSGAKKYATLVKGAAAGWYRILPSVKTGLAQRLTDRCVRTLFENPRRDDGAAVLLDSLRQNRYADADFLFANLMEAHAPYVPPKSYRTTGDASYDEVAATLTDDEPDERLVRGAYDDSVRYLADQYERIFAELQRRFDYVITLSDHGELFGEHGSWRHLHGVYPELTRIPLVISGDGVSGTCSKTVSLLDVHRTVLALLDVEAASRGQNLLGTLDDQFYLVEYEGLRAARLEKMRDRYPDQLVTSYDRPLNGLAGPNEYYGYQTLEGWEEQGSPPAENPRLLLRELAASITRRDEDRKSSVAVSEDVRAKLEHLGYA